MQSNIFDKTKVLEIVKQYKGKRGALIPVLQKIQEYFGYLPEALLDLIADGLNNGCLWSSNILCPVLFKSAR